jgi:hypothetical protein
MTIKNDQEFRAVIDALSIPEQRALGARFVDNVAYLCQEPVIQRGLEAAKNPQLSPTETAEMFKSVKSLAVQTYTNCGDETDWSEQAAHFVAVATRVCLTPQNQLGKKHNLAWKCAIQSRLAKNCAMIDSSSEQLDNVARKQYAIVEDFLPG